MQAMANPRLPGAGDVPRAVTPSTTKKVVNTQLAPDAPTELKLPNERDESVGVTGGVQSPAVQQAYKDVKRGLQDTSRGAAANEAYEKLKEGKS